MHHVAILRWLNELKTVAMIKLIMSKIKSKCKINLLRCRARNQIDAPSVRASKICSPEFSAVQLRSWGTGHSQQIQYRTVSRHISVLLQDYCRGVPLEAAAENWRNIWFIPLQNNPSYIFSPSCTYYWNVVLLLFQHAIIYVHLTLLEKEIKV